MNHLYRVIFNRVLGCWQAVTELAKGSGKIGGSVKRSARRHAAKLAALAAMAAGTGGLVGQVHAQNAPAPNQLPQGGNVTAGNAQINQSGNVMNIDQSTQKAIINWQEFNVGKDATVNFNQPNSSAATLNRVLDSNPSQIFGRIVAPGQVILINPNGAYFAPSASVDVGGLIATTHELADKDFLDGNYAFKRNGATGKIINDGELKAKLDGYIALMAPEVRNQGVIIAERGTVALASGEHIQLDFGTGNKLQGITVTEQDFDAQIENKHAIIAEGGLVILSARATAELRASVIKNSGQIVASAGANTVTQKGGRIILEGNTIEVTEGSELIATGPKGGGEVLIGGDWQGGANEERRVLKTPDAMHQATKVTVKTNTKIDASATDNGDGGTVVVWSDVKNPKSVTTVKGKILAKGGESNGDGGQIETSGAKLITDGVSGSAAAPKGKAGEWLFDPYNISIVSSGGDTSGSFSVGEWGATGDNSTILNTSIEALLNAGTNVTITTAGAGSQSGNITVRDSVSIVKSLGSDVVLTLKANAKVLLESDVQVRSTSGRLEVVLWSDFDQSGSDGSIQFYPRVTINSNGGDIVMGSGVDPRLTTDSTSAPISIEYSSLDAGGGDIVIRGGTGNAMMMSRSISMYETSITTTDQGSVSLEGQEVSLAHSPISTHNGDVTLTSVGVGWSSISYDLFSGSDIRVSGAGNITVQSDGAWLSSGSGQLLYGGDSHTGTVTVKATSFFVNSPSQGLLINTSGDVVLEATDNSLSTSLNTAFLEVSSRVNDLQLGHAGSLTGLVVSNPIEVIGSIELLASNITLPVSLSAGGEVSLGGDLNVTDTLTITAAGVTAAAINLNSHALTIAESGVGEISGEISGSGDIIKAGGGELTLSGALSYTGATTISAGSLVVSNNSPASSSSGFEGGGILRIEPVSTGFTGEFANSGWTFDSTLGGLVIGKLGNTANITIDAALTVTGPISLYGADITVSEPVSTSGGDLLGAGTNFTNTGSIATGGGAVNLNGFSGAINIDASVTTLGGAFTATGASSFDASGVTISTTGRVDEAGGAVTIVTNTGDLTTGPIYASGGSSTSGAGQAAGSVTLNAASALNIVGLIHAKGSAGVASTGGAGGTVSLTGASGIINNGAISTTGGTGTTVGAGGNVTFNSDTEWGFDLSVDTGSGTGDILFAGKVDSVARAAYDVTLTAGTGNITFTGAVGGTHALDAIAINSVGTLTAQNSITTASLVQSAGTLTTLSGNVTTSHANGLNLTATDIRLGGVTINTRINRGIARFNGNVRLDDNVNITRGLGAVSFTGSVDSQASETNTLTLAEQGSDGGGNVEFFGSVGLAVDGELGGLTVNGNTAYITTLHGDVKTVGIQDYNRQVIVADDITLTASSVNFSTFVNSSFSSGMDSNGDSYASSDEHTLAIAGDAVFNGTMGATYEFGSLSVSGTTAIKGASVVTIGAQFYGGAITLGANAQLAASGLSAGAINLDSGASSYNLSVAEAGAGEITGVISGGGTLTKAGAGTLSLSGASTYTGGTTVSAGTLQTSAATTGSVTNGPFGIGTVTVADGATLALQAGATIANNLVLNGAGVGSGGALRSVSGDNEVTGTITLAGTTVRVVSAADNLTLAGNVDATDAGGQSLVLAGAGDVSLRADIGATVEPLNFYSTDLGGTLTLAGDITTSPPIDTIVPNYQKFGVTVIEGGRTLAVGKYAEISFEGSIDVSAQGAGLTLSAISLMDSSAVLRSGTLSLGENALTLVKSRMHVSGLSGGITGTGMIYVEGSQFAIEHSGFLGTVTVDSNSRLQLFDSNETFNFTVLNSGLFRTWRMGYGSVRLKSLSGSGDVELYDNVTLVLLQNQGTISGQVRPYVDPYAHYYMYPDSGGGPATGALELLDGSLTLTGANTYEGLTTVTGGTLGVGHAQALGTSDSGVIVGSGGTLDLQNVAVGAEALTLNGGTLGASTGVSSLAGRITLTSDSIISVGGTSLTLSGQVIADGHSLSVNATGAGVSFTGPVGSVAINYAPNTISSVGGSVDSASTTYVYIQDGLGASVVGQNVKTWGLATAAGTSGRSITPLLFEKVNGEYVLRAIGSPVNPSPGTANQIYAFTVTSGSAQIANENYYFGWKDGGPLAANQGVMSFDVGSGSTTALALTDNSSQNITSIDVGTVLSFGNNTLGNRSYRFSVVTDGGVAALNNLTIAADTLQMSGNVTMTGTLSANVSGNSSISGSVSGGTTSLQKSGAGTLTLSGVNTYGGDTTITAGTLVLANDSPATSSNGFSGNGNLRIESVSASFSSTFNANGWTFGSSLNGLTIGKDTNTARIEISSAIEIAGSIAVYGGSILVAADVVSASGDILLDADTGTMLSQATNGVHINGSGVEVKTLAENLLVGAAGDITIIGRGGDASGTNTPGARTFGVYLQSGASVLAAGAGDATITGYGGMSSQVSSAVGVILSNSSSSNGVSGITVGDGNLTVTGTGGSGADGASGVQVNSFAKLSATGTGTITVNGTAGGGGADANHYGVLIVNFNEASQAAPTASIVTNDGDISISAQAASGYHSLVVSKAGVIEAGGAGDITISADSISLDGTSFGGGQTSELVTSSASSITLQPLTPGTLIDLGGADVLSGSPRTLGLTAEELGLITTGTLNLGSSSAGVLTVSQSIAPENLSNLVFDSGSGLTLSDDITTTGSQTYSADISLGADATLTTVGGDISFAGTVDGSHHLVLSAAAGSTVLSGVVGGTLALSSLNVSGDTSISNPISTTGSQSYTGAIALGATTTLTGSGLSAGAIDLGTYILTLAEVGTGLITGVVSGSGSLVKSGAGTLSLTAASTYSGGTTVSEGALKAGASSTGSITTSPFGTGAVTVSGGAAVDLNGQTIANALTIQGTGASSSGVLFNSAVSAATVNGAVTLTGNTTIKSTGGLTFNQTINGAYGLTVAGDGGIGFGSTLGASTALASLSIDGTAQLHANIKTTGAQVYGGDVTLHHRVDLTASDVTFSGKVDSVTDGTYPLRVNASGTTRFDGLVGSVGRLQVLGTDAGGQTVINTSSIKVGGTQEYSDAVVLESDTTLTSSRLLIRNTVNGANALTTNTIGETSFEGNVGGVTPLASLSTTASGQVFLKSTAITTTGAQTYGNKVYVANNLTLSGGSLTFANTLDRQVGYAASQANLTLNAAGDTTFNGLVGKESYLSSVTTDAAGQTLLKGGWLEATTVTIADPLSLSADAMVDFKTMSLASVDLISHDLTLETTGSGTVSGAITGTGGLIKTRVGSVTLSSAASTYSGGTTIALNGGTLKAGASTTGSVTSGPFGTGSITVEYGGTLDLNGQTIANNVVAQGPGTGVATPGAIYNSSANAATLTGDLSLSAATRMTNVGDLTISGSITGVSVARDLVIVNTGLVTLSGGVDVASLSATGPLNIQGTISSSTGLSVGGELGLSADTTLTGTNLSLAGIALSSHQLTLNEFGTGSISGAITGTGSLVKLGAGTVTLSGNSDYDGGTTVTAGTLKAGVSVNDPFTTGPFGTGAVTIADGASLDLNGQSIANTVTAQGAGLSSAGVIYNSSSDSATLGGALTLSNDTTLKTTGDLALTGGVTGAVALTIENTGTVTLGGGVSVASISSTGAVALAGTITTSAGLSFGGELGLSANTTLTGSNMSLAGVDLGNFDLTLNESVSGTVAGAITGVGGFIKQGVGTVTLSGGSDYAGGTTVSAGTLKLGSSSNSPFTTGPLGTGAVTVAGGASLDLNGNAISNVVTAQGAGVNSAGVIYNSSSDTASIGGLLTLVNNTTIKTIGELGLTGGVTGTYALTIDNVGTVSLAGGVDVASISVAAEVGLSGNIQSSGTQTYSGATSINAATTVLADSVWFVGAVDGSTSLGVIANTGFIIIDSSVGQLNPLQDLSLTSTAGIELGGNVTTVGQQSYNGAVTLAQATNLTGGDITFNGGFAGGQALSVVSSGNLGINAQIGTTDLASIDAQAGGVISLGATRIEVLGHQRYRGAVELTQDTTLSASAIVFDETLDSDGTARDLTLSSSSGDIQFGGAVGGSSALDAITITSVATLTASSSIEAGSFAQQTGGVLSQFDGAVALSGNFSFIGHALTLNASNNIVGGSMTVTNSGTFTTADVADITTTGLFSQLGTGNTVLGADLSSGTSINFSASITLASSDLVTISTGEADTDDFTITGGINSTSNESLTIDAGALGDIDLNGVVNLGAGDFTIVDAAVVDFASTLVAGDFTQADGAMSTAFNGKVDLSGNFDFTGQALMLNAAGNTVGGTMNVTNSGHFATADMADLTVIGQFTQDGAGTSRLGGNLTALAGIDFATAIALIGTDAVSLATGGEADQDIVLGADATTGITGAGQALTLNAGLAGDITVRGDLGAAGAALGDVAVVGADQAVFEAPLYASSFIQHASNVSTGMTTFADAIDISNDFDFTGHGLTLNGAVAVGADFEVTNSGLLAKGITGDISVAGDLSQNGTGGLRLANSAVTASGDISIAGATTLANNVRFAAQNITTGMIDSDVARLYGVTLDARESVTLAGAVGQLGRLASLATGSSGTLTINAKLVSTAGDQNYNVPLTFVAGSLASPLVLRSQNGDIEFGSTISAGKNSKGATRSLTVEALNGNVYVRDQVGVSLAGVQFGDYQSSTDTNPYGFNVTAADIWLYADVTTFEEQLYDGRVHIGNNGTNGFTRSLISLDPSVVFTSTIDDTVWMTHTLDVRAVTTNPGNGLVPDVQFNGNVGQSVALYGMSALVGVQARSNGALASQVNIDPPGARFGKVTIAGNVSTSGNQTYIGGAIEIGSNGGVPVSLYSESGTVRLLARPDATGGLINGSNLRIALGDGASLDLETLSLFRQSGLTPASIVQYVGLLGSVLSSGSANSAGADLERVTTGMQAEQTAMNQTNVSDGGSQVLMQAEIEVGSMQAVECEASDATAARGNDPAGTSAAVSLECAPAAGASGAQ